MRKFSLLFIIVICALWCSGCDKVSTDLTKIRAKNILVKESREPIEARIAVRILTAGESVTGKEPVLQHTEHQNHRLILDKLQSVGYLSQKPVSSTDDWYIHYYIHATPNDQLKKYVVRDNEDSLDVLVGEVVVDEITRISRKDPNSRIVEYRTRVVLNELGKLLNYEHKDSNVRYSSFHRHTDDDWHLEA